MFNLDLLGERSAQLIQKSIFISIVQYLTASISAVGQTVHEVNIV